MPLPLAAGARKEKERLRAVILGSVQGVGFRPFIYRLAAEMGLKGWVNNGPRGVTIEVEGGTTVLVDFLERMKKEKPAVSFIQSLETSFLDPVGHETFEIRSSDASGLKQAFVLPDIAACAECLSEIFDPSNRRYRYPFTNCTHCGPRFTIIEALPYDRANTSMKKFLMCGRCGAEYENPIDRRFHAQPNACADCGPNLEFWDGLGRNLAVKEEALHLAEDAIRQGRIVAVKGLGGFHLMVDARSEKAVQRLRENKRREEKPLAVMLPTLEQVQSCCEVSKTEERLLNSPESPIVLLKRKASDSKQTIASNVAPRNPYLG